MSTNPFEPFLQYGDNALELSESYHALVARNSPTPLYLSLPEAEQEKARAIAISSPVRKYSDVLQFGISAQEDVKKFSNQLFSQIKKADTYKINGILHQLIMQLEQINIDRLKPESGGFLKKLFRKNNAATIQQTVSHYKKLSRQVDRLAIELKYAQGDLLYEDARLNHIYDQNKQHFMQLNVFIASCELKLQELREVSLPQLAASVAESEDVFYKQSTKDLEQAIEWLDRRKYDLEISREITIQSAPQILMTQATNRMLAEKINGSILATIPMWQTQISTILTLGQRSRLQQTQHRVDRLSEQMLDTNIQAVLDVSDDGLDDLERLKKTQATLVDSLVEATTKQTDNSSENTSIDPTESIAKRTRRSQPKK